MIRNIKQINIKSLGKMLMLIIIGRQQNMLLKGWIRGSNLTSAGSTPGLQVPQLSRLIMEIIIKNILVTRLQ